MPSAGCDAPAYHSQAHHVTAWTSTGRTDITELTLACDPDNRLAEKGWTTRKNTHGHTEWLPPPHLDEDRVISDGPSEAGRARSPWPDNKWGPGPTRTG